MEEYQKNLDDLDYTEEEFIIKKVNELLAFYKEVVKSLEKNGLDVNRFQHLDNFIEWLQTHTDWNADANYIALSILELVRSYEASGLAVYELSKFERASQNDFAFSYEVEPAEFDDDGELIKDEVFIF